MESKLYSFLGLMQRSGNIVSGDDGVEIDIKKAKCKLLIIAEDASDNTKKKFFNMAQYRNVPVIIFGTKEELGGAIGKSARAALSVRDDGFAREFINKHRAEINGGEIIVKS